MMLNRLRQPKGPVGILSVVATLVLALWGVFVIVASSRVGSSGSAADSEQKEALTRSVDAGTVRRCLGESSSLRAGSTNR